MVSALLGGNPMHKAQVMASRNKYGLISGLLSTARFGFLRTNTQSFRGFRLGISFLKFFVQIIVKYIGAGQFALLLVNGLSIQVIKRW